MRVRDAVEADAAEIAAIADTPEDAMLNLIHDRTVRVAESDARDVDPNRDAGDDEPDVLGFVSFDARDDTVHVTQIDGTEAACERLLDEPIRFARSEGMTVELLAPITEEDIGAVAEAVGFSRAGRGPQFEGKPTVRYRLDPSSA